jgi:hypothetical protein
MDADLLEDAALHHCHDAAATGRAGMIGPAPRRPHKPAGRAIGQWRASGQGVFQRLESGNDAVAQGLEPFPRLFFAPFYLGIVHVIAGGSDLVHNVTKLHDY